MTEELKPVEKLTRRQLEKEAEAAGVPDAKGKLTPGLRSAVRTARKSSSHSSNPNRRRSE